MPAAGSCWPSAASSSWRPCRGRRSSGTASRPVSVPNPAPGPACSPSSGVPKPSGAAAKSSGVAKPSPVPNQWPSSGPAQAPESETGALPLLPPGP
ncbi:hypothetical protein BJF78_27490 [Pseudonocardia sp. CNS-139]|nr:hypothetical protein BJF78_27490 [Pseudonocardia sp. CNS-139]